VKKFIDSKEKIYELYNSEGLMGKKNLQNTIQYLDDFYDVIENEKSLERHILKQCRE